MTVPRESSTLPPPLSTDEKVRIINAALARIPHANIPACLLVHIEADLAAEDHGLLIIPNPDRRTEWLDNVALMFPVCGVCFEGRSGTVTLTRPWTSEKVAFKLATGFISCNAPACVKVGELRAKCRELSGYFPSTDDAQQKVFKGCAHCASPREWAHTQLCGACKSVRYCGRRCQAAHWKFHKKACSENRV